MGYIVFKHGPKLEPKLQAFDYQVAAVDAVRNLPFAAVFHEQGLGKTKIAIDVMLHWFTRDIVDTVLLVTKKMLVENWKRELIAHSHISPRTLTSNRRHNFYTLNSPSRMVLTHFEGVKMELQRLKLFCRTRRVAAVLDESARIKNPDSNLTRALFELAPGFHRRIILTGTPVANRPYDIWAQIYFLDRGESLGTSFDEFKRNLDLSNDLGSSDRDRRVFEEALSKVFSKIDAFCVRETKDSGCIRLPAKEIHRVPAAWRPRQLALYKAVRDETRVSVVRDGLHVEDESEDILKRLLRLVQIASNPRLIDEAYNEEPGKWHVLIELLERIERAGEKAIVWTNFTENADWLHKSLSGKGAVVLHGRLSIEQRNRSINRFLQDDICRVLVATPGAAKEGLTLTVANHVIFYDRGFSLDDYLQAQDRIHRISQSKTCYIYNLIMPESVDEWIDVLLHAKRTAAQLAQGDITLDAYRSTMTYSFGDVLRAVLGIEQEEDNREQEK